MNIEHDAQAGRFFARLEDGEAVLEYARPDERTIDLRHTFVPRPARGEDVGEELVETALRYAREHQLRVIPSCPFVAAWLKDHPEHADLVAGA